MFYLLIFDFDFVLMFISKSHDIKNTIFRQKHVNFNEKVLLIPFFFLTIFYFQNQENMKTCLILYIFFVLKTQKLKK